VYEKKQGRGEEWERCRRGAGQPCRCRKGVRAKKEFPAAGRQNAAARKRD